MPAPTLSEIAANARRARQYMDRPGARERVMRESGYVEPDAWQDTSRSTDPLTRATGLVKPRASSSGKMPGVIQTGEVLDSVQLPTGELAPVETPSGALVKVPGRSNLYVDPVTKDPYKPDPTSPTGLRSAWSDATRRVRNGRVMAVLPGVGERDLGLDEATLQKQAQAQVKAHAKATYDQMAEDMWKQRRPFRRDETGRPVPLQDDETWKTQQADKLAKAREEARVKGLRRDIDLLEIERDRIRKPETKDIKAAQLQVDALAQSLRDSPKVGSPDLEREAEKLKDDPEMGETARAYLDAAKQRRALDEPEQNARKIQDRILDLKEQVLDPKAWKEARAQTIKTATDDQLTELAERDEDVANARMGEIKAKAEELTAKDEAFIKEQADLVATRDEALRIGADAETIRQLDEQQKDLTRRIYEHEGITTDAREELTATGQVVQDRQETAQAAKKELIRRQEAKREEDLAKLESSPILAPVAKKLRDLSQEVDARAAVLVDMYPDGVPEEARKALEQDIAAKDQQLTAEYTQADQQREAALDDLYKNWARGDRVTFTHDLDEQYRNELINQAKKRRLTEREAREGLEMRAVWDWSVARKTNPKTGREELEDYRVDPKGQIAVNPAYYLKPDKYAQIVNSVEASDEDKARAMEMRRELAAPMASDVYWELTKHPEFVEWLEKNKKSTILDTIDAFVKEMESGGQLSATMARFSSGGAAIGKAVTGLAAMLFPSETTREAAKFWSDRQNFWETAAKFADKDKGLAGTLPSKVIGGVPSVLFAMAGGRLGSLLSQWKYAPLAASAVTAGAQSGGGTFIDATEAYMRQGLSQTEAEVKARLPALISGSITAAATALGGYSGAESLLRPAVANEVKKKISQRLAEVGYDVTEEAFEEWWDQMAQGILAQKTYAPDKPAEQVLSEALEAGLVGGILGGGISAGRAVMDRGQTTQGTDTQGPTPAPTPEATPPGPPPEMRVAVRDALTAFEPTGVPLPKQVQTQIKLSGKNPSKVAKDAAAAVVAIAQGQSLESLPSAQLEAMGWKRGAKGLELLDKNVQPLVYLEQGQPVIRQEAKDWLESEDQPLLADQIGQTETERLTTIRAPKPEPAPTPAPEATVTPPATVAPTPAVQPTAPTVQPTTPAAQAETAPVSPPVQPTPAKPKAAPPERRKAIGKGMAGKPAYAEFQTDQDADAFTYQADLKRGNSTDISPAKSKAATASAQSKLAKISKATGIPEIELRPLLAEYNQEVSAQARTVPENQAFTPVTFAEFAAAKRAKAPTPVPPNIQRSRVKLAERFAGRAMPVTDPDRAKLSQYLDPAEAQTPLGRMTVSQAVRAGILAETTLPDGQRAVTVPGQEQAATSAPEQQTATTPQTEAQDAVDAWQRQNRTTWTDELQEGELVSAKAFDAVAEQGRNLPAHGMAKASPAKALGDLIGILTNGIKISASGKGLHFAPLAKPKGEAGLSTTAGGVAVRDGAFILVGKPGTDMTDAGQITAVLVNPALDAETVAKIREAVQAIRPDIRVESYTDVGKAIAPATTTQETAPQRTEAEPAPRPTTTDKPVPVSEALDAVKAALLPVVQASKTMPAALARKTVAAAKALLDTMQKLPDVVNVLVVANSPEGGPGLYMQSTADGKTMWVELDPARAVMDIAENTPDTSTASKAMRKRITHELIHVAAEEKVGGNRIRQMWRSLPKELQEKSLAAYNYGYTSQGITPPKLSDFQAGHEFLAQLIEARLTGEITSEALKEPGLAKRLIDLMRDLVAALRDLTRTIPDAATRKSLEEEADAVEARLRELAGQAALETSTPADGGQTEGGGVSQQAASEPATPSPGSSVGVAGPSVTPQPQASTTETAPTPPPVSAEPQPPTAPNAANQEPQQGGVQQERQQGVQGGNATQISPGNRVQRPTPRPRQEGQEVGAFSMFPPGRSFQWAKDTWTVQDMTPDTLTIQNPAGRVITLTRGSRQANRFLAQVVRDILGAPESAAAEPTPEPMDPDTMAEQEADNLIADYDLAGQQAKARADLEALEQLRTDPEAIQAMAATNPRGTPELANIGETEQGRAMMRAAQEARELNGREISHQDAVMEAAQQDIANNRQEVERALFARLEEDGALNEREVAQVRVLRNYYERDLALDPTNRDLLRKMVMLDYHWLNAGTEAGRALALRRDFQQSPLERMRESIAAVNQPPAAIRAKINAAWTPGRKAREITRLEGELAKAKGDAKTAKQAELDAARAIKTRDDLLMEYQEENKRLKQEILDRMKLSEDDIMLNPEDRHAIQEALMDLPRVKEELAKLPAESRRAIVFAVRGYSDKQIAQRTGVREDEVARLAQNFRENILKPEIAKTVKAGNTFGALVKRGLDMIGRLLGAPGTKTDTFGNLVAQGDISPQDAANIGAEVARILDYAMQPSRVRNRPGSLTAKVVTSPGGQRVRIFVPFDPDDVKAFYRYARELSTRKSSAFDKLYEYWVSSILSGPQTQAANFAGNVGQIAWNYTAQRWAEMTINLVMRDPNSPRWGEYPRVIKAMIKSAAAAWKQAVLAYSTEHDNTHTEYLNKPLEADFTDGALDKVGAQRAAIGGGFGRFVRISGRLLRFQDAFFKTAILHAEAAAYAYREAKAKGLSGQALESYMDTRLATRGTDVWTKAMDYAEDLLFQSDNAWTDAAEVIARPKWLVSRYLKQMAEAEAKQDWSAYRKAQEKLVLSKFIAGALRFLVPFVRTPTNILRIGLRKAGGAAIGAMLGTMAGTYQVMKGQPFAKGYPQALLVRDLAESSIAMMAWMLLASAAEGDDDDDKKQILFIGNRPYGAASEGELATVNRQYGGTNMLIVRDSQGNEIMKVPFGRYEPFATTIGFMVDSIREWKEAKKTIKNGEPADPLGPIFKNLLANAQNKTFLQGLSGFSKTLQDIGDGKATAGSISKNILAGFVPNIIKQPMRNMDPLMRQSPREASLLHNMLPGGWFAEPRLNPATGEPVRKEGPGIARVLVQTATETGKQPDEPLLKANRMYPGERWDPEPIQKKDFYVVRPGTKEGDPNRKLPLTDAKDKSALQRLVGKLYSQRAKAVTATLTARERQKPGPAVIDRYKAAMESARAEARKVLPLTRRPVEAKKP